MKETSAHNCLTSHCACKPVKHFLRHVSEMLKFLLLVSVIWFNCTCEIARLLTYYLLILFFKSITEISQSSTKIKYNIECWKLSLQEYNFSIPFLTCLSLHSVFVDLFLWTHHQLLAHLPKDKDNIFLKKNGKWYICFSSNLRGSRG